MRFTVFLLVFISLFCNIYGQVFLSGVLLDSAKNPLALQNISINKGRHEQQSYTDFEGKFSFKVKKNSEYKLSVPGNLDTTLYILNDCLDVSLFIPHASKIMSVVWSEIYNEETARSDIANGQIYLLTCEFHIFPSRKIARKLNRITAKYGFRYKNISLSIDPGLDEAMQNYNRYVMEYLDKINKPGWYEKMRFKVNKLFGNNYN